MDSNPSSTSSYFAALTMILVQFAYGGSTLIVKVALQKELNQLVFIIYRHVIAFLIFSPFAFIYERKKRNNLSFKLVLQIFVVALFGSTVHLNLVYFGLHYSSAAVASALANATPSLTFLMAFMLGLEKLKTRSRRSQAKIMGTILCIAGSLVFTLWKGSYIFKSFTEKPLITIHATHNIKENWTKGCLLILLANLSWSIQQILQAMILKVYPSPLTINALICFFVVLQNAVLAAVFLRGKTEVWKIEWNIQLCTYIYCGIVVSGVVYYAQTWCIAKKGPVFGTVFNPLQVVIVGIFSAIAFAERFHIGSMVGAVLVIAGLYLVVWGKRLDNFLNDNNKAIAHRNTHVEL